MKYLKILLFLLVLLSANTALSQPKKNQNLRKKLKLLTEKVDNIRQQLTTEEEVGVDNSGLEDRVAALETSLATIESSLNGLLGNSQVSALRSLRPSKWNVVSYFYVLRENQEYSPHKDTFEVIFTPATTTSGQMQVSEFPMKAASDRFADRFFGEKLALVTGEWTADYTINDYRIITTNYIGPRGDNCSSVSSADNTCRRTVFQNSFIQVNQDTLRTDWFFSNQSVSLMRVPECADGIDNNGDALIDFGQDPACSSVDDLEGDQSL